MTRPTNWEGNLKWGWILAGVAFFAAWALFLWRTDMPYPQIAGWDILAHQTLFNEIQKGNLSLFPPRISDTFLVTSYPPTFAILLGAVEKALPYLSLDKVYFLLDTLHLLIGAALSGWIGWVATRRKLGALAAGAFGVFVFESTVVQTSLFFTPQSWAAVLGTLGITLLFFRKNKAAGILLLLAFLFHFVIGSGAALLGGTAFLFQKLLPKRGGRALIFGLSLAALSAGILTNLIPLDLNPLQTAESREFNFTLLQKWELIRNWYGFLWIFYLVGAGAALKKRREELDLTLALSLCALAASALFAPYSLKFYTLARFLVHAIAAAGVIYLLDPLKPAFRYGLFTFLVAAQVLTFNVSQKNFKEAFAYKNIFTTVSQDEIDAARFLKPRYGERGDVLLVSDPATQHVLEAFSNVNTQGGAFANLETRQAVDKIFPETNPQKVKESLFTINDRLYPNSPSTILFAVSGRFLVWQNLPDLLREDQTYLIWGPKELDPEGLDYIELLTKGGFRKVFQNPAMAVLEVER